MPTTKMRVGVVRIPAHDEPRKVYGIHRGQDGKLYGRCNVGKTYGHYVFDDKQRVWVRRA